jgi:hypothetical protein
MKLNRRIISRACSFVVSWSFAYWNGGGPERLSARSLTDGVCEEAYRDALLSLAHLDFRLLRLDAMLA